MNTKYVINTNSHVWFTNNEKTFFNLIKKLSYLEIDYNIHSDLEFKTVDLQVKFKDKE